MTTMTRNEKILKKEMLPKSISSDWELAKSEWILIEIGIDWSVQSTCLCTHFPIKYLCHLWNENTNKRVIVGNCCVTKFFKKQLSVNIIFSAFKRIIENIYNTLNKQSIMFLFERGWLNEWEQNFYHNVCRKQYLSEKQSKKVMEINVRILKNLKISTEMIDKAKLMSPKPVRPKIEYHEYW